MPDVRVEVSKTSNARCERCWRHRDDVGSNQAYPTLCGRCANVLSSFGCADRLRKISRRLRKRLEKNLKHEALAARLAAPLRSGSAHEIARPHAHFDRRADPGHTGFFQSRAGSQHRRSLRNAEGQQSFLRDPFFLRLDHPCDSRLEGCLPRLDVAVGGRIARCRSCRQSDRPHSARSRGGLSRLSSCPWYGRWPAFNVADSCICVAAGLFILGSFLDGKRRKAQPSLP